MSIIFKRKTLMYKKTIGRTFFFVLLTTVAVSGCSVRRPVEADRKFAVLYAELMLLNEREGSTHTISDSAYRKHAADLLAHNGTSESGFKNKTELLMQDDRAWRDILSIVSLVFDSIKTERTQRSNNQRPTD